MYIRDSINNKLAEVISLLLSIDIEENIKDHISFQLHKIKNDIAGELVNNIQEEESELVKHYRIHYPEKADRLKELQEQLYDGNEIDGINWKILAEITALREEEFSRDEEGFFKVMEKINEKE